jgi:hypothetical protein
MHYKRFYQSVQLPHPYSTADPKPTSAQCAALAVNASLFNEVRCARWGLFSMMRDLGSWIIKDLSEGKASLQRSDVGHLCKKYCNNARGTFDQHLGCFFAPLSACHSPYEGHSGPPSRIDLSNAATMQMDSLEIDALAGPGDWDKWLLEGGTRWASHASLQPPDSPRAHVELVSRLPVPVGAAAHSSYTHPDEESVNRKTSAAPAPAQKPACASSAQYEQAVKISFLRSMIAGLSYRPLPEIIGKVLTLENAFGLAKHTHTPLNRNARHLHHPMLILHARRTDKANDQGLVKAVRDKYPSGQLPVSVYVDMMRTLEREVLDGQQFKSIFVLSDDLEVWNHRDEFGNRTVLVNPYWTHGQTSELLNDNEWRRRGHVKLRVLGNKAGEDSLMFNFHAQLVVDVLFAAKHGDYLLGCGGSGVSQLIAQLLGHRERIDGSWLSLWEEDFLEMETRE